MQSGILIRSLAFALVLLTGGIANAQFDFGGLGDLGGLPGGEQVSVTAEFTTAPGSKAGQLHVTATIEPGWHIYSITQAKGATMPTKIDVTTSDAFQLVGPFKAAQEPKIKNTELYPVPLEEHYDEVTWTAPILLSEGTDPQSLEIPVKVSLQVCDEDSKCIPKVGPNALKATAKHAGEVEIAATEAEDTPPLPGFDVTRSDNDSNSNSYGEASALDPFTAPGWNVQFHGVIEPEVVAPGSIARLRFTAEPLNDNHVYVWGAETDPAFSSTLLAVEVPEGWKVSEPIASTEPVVKKSKLASIPDVIYHEGPVTWTVEIHVPETATEGHVYLPGVVGFQTCTENSCDPPNAAQFRGSLTVGEARADGEAALAFRTLESEEPYKAAAEQVAGLRAATEIAKPAGSDSFNLDSLAVQDSGKNRTLIAVIGIAVLGGFILNFMPCVLPVIGLKVMSFVQQAGESRAKIFALNMWYALGMFSVFMVLATLAVVWNVGWGQQFTDDTFQIVMASVVFAMALSFLGVWEIPIPGFVGSGKAMEASEKEGPLAAILKGALTTILATPCSGPGLGTALAWCNGKPTVEVYLVFAALGLGMASPYILIGIFPKLVNWLPKPGNWMDTFKQVMGFVLLGTVVFFFTFMSWDMIIPTLALLFGIWAGVWWIGRTPVYSDLHTKIRSWSFGAAFAALIGIVAFTWLVDISRERFENTVNREIGKRMDQSRKLAVEPVSHEAKIPWQPFSEERLKALAEENRTVMIDFTADWCLTCKTLEKTVLNTDPVRESLKENNVETLMADWTDGDEEITLMLNRLGSAAVPVLAIFPAGRPNEPIVLKDGYTQATVLQKLKEAGPSKATAPVDEVAENTPGRRGA